MSTDPGQERSSAGRRLSHSTVRWVAIAEATSFIVLMICVVFKYSGPKAAGPVMVMGWVHGLLFLAYLWVIIRARSAFGWGRRRTAIAAISSVIPFAPYFVAHGEPTD